MSDKLSKAESILAEAKSYAIIDSVPDDEKDKISMSEELVQRARIQHDQFHNREPVILAILFAADVDGGTSSGAKENLEENTSAKETTEQSKSEPSQKISTETERGIREETALDLVVEDFTSLSDREVRQLHSKFNAVASRTAYLLVLEENDSHDCKVIAEARRNELLASLAGSKSSVALLDAQISDDGELAKWRNRQYDHEKRVRYLKMQRDVANSNVERLSREWTMRSDERNGSGQLPFKMDSNG